MPKGKKAIEAKSNGSTLKEEKKEIVAVKDEKKEIVYPNFSNTNFPQLHPNDYWKVVLFMIVGNEDKPCTVARPSNEGRAVNRENEKETVPLIIRMLRSVTPFVSGVCICPNQNQTTVELIRDYCEEHKIPYALNCKTWKSFGHNRSESYEECVRFVKSIALPRTRTYLLTLDADMEIVDEDVYSTYKKDSLSSEGQGRPFTELLKLEKNLGGVGYTLVQRFNSGLFNHNMRMMRSDHIWKCVRRTHEYWDNPTKEPMLKLNRPYILDHDDGGTKDTKYIRDHQLLAEDIEEFHDARAHFYMGNTCHSLYCIYKHKYDFLTHQQMGKEEREKKHKLTEDEIKIKEDAKKLRDKYFDECILNHTKVVDLWDNGGNAWHQEVYMACHCMTRIYLSVDDDLNAIKWASYGYKHDRDRSETLYLLTEHFRDRAKGRDQQVAFDYAMIGRKIPLPSGDKGDKLFLESEIYQWKFDWEINILAFYVPGARMEAIKASDRVLVSEAPNYAKERLWNNMKYYFNPIEREIRTFVPLPFPFLPTLDGSSHYRPCNPSILKIKSMVFEDCGAFCIVPSSNPLPEQEGYLVNLRMVNYSSTFRNGNYDFPDDDGKCRTRNLLLFVNKEYQIVKQLELIDANDEVKGTMVLGIEDIRLISLKEEEGKSLLTFLGTCRLTRDLPEQTICFAYVPSDLSTTEVKVHKKMPLPSIKGECTEKNWVPLPGSNEDKVDLIYYHYPWQTVTFTPSANKMEVNPAFSSSSVEKKDIIPLPKERGSASPVLVLWEGKKYYIGLTHSCIYDGHARYYYHRWIQYKQKNGQFLPIAASMSFCFKDKGIEFSCGITQSYDQKKMIVALGIGDRDACLCLIDTTKVLESLQIDL